jgi:hypothetical protein
MAYFAKINNDNTVEEVIVVNDEDILDKKGKESEKVGQTFIKSVGLEGVWIQTSDIGSLIGGKDRGPYAGIGYIWDGKKFIDPNPIATENIIE